jgi:hypothetical protein
VALVALPTFRSGAPIVLSRRARRIRIASVFLAIDFGRQLKRRVLLARFPVRVEPLGQVVGRRRRPVGPVLAPTVAQPEDAGADVRRIVHLLGENSLLAAPQHRAPHFARIADRALVERVRHAAVGHSAALEHGSGELGNARDPVVDGARRHVEETGELRVGGAEQAIVARQLAEFGAVTGRTSDGAHGRNIISVIHIVNWCYFPDR